MLGEASTTEIHRNKNSKGIEKLIEDSKIGGTIAGNARKDLEKKLGRSIVTDTNFLKTPEKIQRLSNQPIFLDTPIKPSGKKSKR